MSRLPAHRLQNRALSGASASARSDKRRWPLRKVVGDAIVEIAPGAEVRRDLLECGHTMPQAHDLFGDTYPARRRCRWCFEAATSDKDVTVRAVTRRDREGA